MQDGEASERAWAAVDDVYAALQAVEPRSARTAAFFDDAVRQLNDVLDARRDRLDDAEGGLPWVIVVLLLVGSLVILGYTILVGSRSLGFHAVGAASIALVVGLSLVVLIALVYPFSGDLAVGPEPFRTGGLARFFGPSDARMSLLHDLSTGWLVLAVFAGMYLLAAAIYVCVTALATGRRADAFKSVSPGLLPPWASSSVFSSGSSSRTSGAIPLERNRPSIGRRAPCGPSISDRMRFRTRRMRACARSFVATSTTP